MPGSETFDRLIGETGDFSVRALVSTRGDADTREPYVLVESQDGECWLPWGQAELVAQVLEGRGDVHPDGMHISAFFGVGEDDRGIQFRAHDVRQGNLMVPHEDADQLATLLRDAAGAVEVIEGIDELP